MLLGDSISEKVPDTFSVPPFPSLGFSNIWAGGGINAGRFVGATDRRGEDAVERICGPGDFLATIYHHLGIDYARTMIRDFNGRPTAIVDHGRAIPELIG